MNQDIRTIKHILIVWAVVISLLALWSIGSYAYGLYKAKQAAAQDEEEAQAVKNVSVNVSGLKLA